MAAVDIKNRIVEIINDGLAPEVYYEVRSWLESLSTQEAINKIVDTIIEATHEEVSDCCGAQILDTWYGILHLVNCAECGEPQA